RDQRGDVDGTVSYLQQILAEDPQHEGAFSRLGDVLRGQERWYDLIELLRKEAGLLLGEGAERAAVSKLLAVARVWTDQLDNPETGAEVLEEALQQDGDNVGALAELARLYEKTEDWDRCLEVLEKASALEPSTGDAAELEFRKGCVIAARGGELTSVEEHYVRALALVPDHVEAVVALEALARKAGRWEKVAELLEVRAGRADADERLAIYRELGALYRDKLDQALRSVEIWERAREFAPQDISVLVPLAEAYAEADRLDQAEPILLALVEASGNRRSKELARYLHLLGVVSERRQDMDGAKEHYEKAYRIDSTNGPTLVALGRVYLAQNDWQAARRIYRSMLLQNPKEDWGITRAQIFGALGKVHAALGEIPKAKSMFERGLEIEPDSVDLRDALDLLD
ncbi:MAG: tetratricopeptide repeat protein, partial [Deltaproteobacteria bacterium]|nr:tetratricopeptide repeat protein [Deltaproteobacteria bacterium]